MSADAVESSGQASRITADAAQADFPRLLDRAARGERITITRDGREVARIGPCADFPTPPHDPNETAEQARERRQRAADAIVARRKNFKPVSSQEIVAMIRADRESH